MTIEISLLLTKEKLERSPGKGRTLYELADGVTALDISFMLYTLIEHVLSTNDSTCYIRALL